MAFRSMKLNATTDYEYTDKIGHKKPTVHVQRTITQKMVEQDNLVDEVSS